jgi:hypothetical protein
MLKALFFSCWIVLAAGHGAVVSPATRNAIESLMNASTYPAGDGACPCANGAIPGSEENTRSCANANACYWFSQGCSIGCESCDGTPTKYKDLCGNNASATLLDPTKRTFNRDCVGSCLGSADDWSRHHPWRAPGSAPVLDACGVAGGSHNKEYNTDGAMYPGDWSHGASHAGPKTKYAAFGDNGTNVLSVGPKATWKAGSHAEVAW